MDVFSWLLWPIYIVAVLFLVLTVTVGAVSIWPSYWDRKLYAAAEAEIGRRFAQVRTAAQTDHIAAQRLLGHTPKPIDDEDDRQAIVLDVVGVMINASDRAQLDAELRQRRNRLEISALKRQVQIVAGIPSLTIASYLWAICRAVNVAVFSLCGLIWYLPRAIPYLVKVHGKHLAGASIGGVFLGVLLAAFLVAGSPNVVSTDWAVIVGDTAMIVTITVLATGTFSVFRDLATTRFGEISQWTRKGILMGTITTAFVSVMLYLDLSGQFSQWQHELTVNVQHLQLSKQVSNWIAGVLVLAFLSYIARNAWTWIWSRAVRLSDRISSAAALFFVVLMGVLFVFFLVGVPLANVDGVLIGGMWTVMAVTLIAFVAFAVEWVQKYREITRAGWTVRRKGFRWWALIAFAATGIIVTATWPLFSAIGVLSADPVAYQICGTLYGFLTLVWSLAFIPGIVITVLYVRRVSKTYQDLMHRQAPKHPFLAGD